VFTLTAEDYEQVRLLPQSPSVAPADEPTDPLTSDMISRANVYLQVKIVEMNADDKRSVQMVVNLQAGRHQQAMHE
jgi:hypothetical protein